MVKHVFFTLSLRRLRLISTETVLEIILKLSLIVLRYNIDDINMYIY